MSASVSLTYYDKILAGIAASLLGGAVLVVATDLRLHLGLVIGAVAATVFVYLGAFRNPPLPQTSARVKAAAVAWHAFLAVLFFSTFL